MERNSNFIQFHLNLITIQGKFKFKINSKGFRANNVNLFQLKLNLFAFDVITEPKKYINKCSEKLFDLLVDVQFNPFCLQNECNNHIITNENL